MNHRPASEVIPTTCAFVVDPVSSSMSSQRSNDLTHESDVFSRSSSRRCPLHMLALLPTCSAIKIRPASGNMSSLPALQTQWLTLHLTDSAHFRCFPHRFKR